MQNIYLFILDFTVFLPITLVRLLFIYLYGSKYNIPSLGFLDVMMHSDDKYFNQNGDYKKVNTIQEDIRNRINTDSIINNHINNESINNQINRLETINNICESEENNSIGNNENSEEIYDIELDNELSKRLKEKLEEQINSSKYYEVFKKKHNINNIGNVNINDNSDDYNNNNTEDFMENKNKLINLLDNLGN